MESEAKSAGSALYERLEVLHTDSGSTAVDRIKAIMAKGFKCGVMIINTPNDVRLNTIDPATYANNFVRIVQAVEADSTARACANFEVINEPEQKAASSAGVDRYYPGHYAAIYVATINAMRAAGIAKADATCLFSGVDPLSWTSQFESQGYWLGAGAAAQPTLAGKIEAISSHPYGDNVDGIGAYWGGEVLASRGWRSVETWRKAALAQGVDVPWHITEFGTTNDDARAGLVTRVLNDARDKYPWIHSVYYFQARDYGSSDTWGMFNGSQTAKPGWSAWKSWIGANSGAGKVLRP